MFFPYLFLLTFCACITMGIYGLVLNPKGGMNRAFAVFSFIISFWAFGDIFYYTAQDYSSGLFWYRITIIGWSGIIFGFFYLFGEFSGFYKKIPLIIKAAVFIYTLIIIYIQFNEPLIYTQTKYGPIEDISLSSPGFYLLNGTLLIEVIAGTFMILKSISKNRSNRVKRMLKIFLMVFYISYFISVFLNIIQIFFTKPVPFIGSTFMLFFLSSTLYLIKKYRMLRLDYRLLQNESFDIISDFIIIISPDKKIININNAVRHSIKTGEIFVSGLIENKKEFEIYLDEAVSMKPGMQKKYVLFKGINGESISTYMSICPVIDKFRDYCGAILIAKPLYEFEEIIRQYKITVQEKKVIFLLREGFMNKEIADKMKISEGVVKNYIYNIYQKTAVDNRVGLLQLFFPAEV